MQLPLVRGRFNATNPNDKVNATSAPRRGCIHFVFSPPVKSPRNFHHTSRIFCYNNVMKSLRSKVKSGQTMLEYIIVFVALLGVLGAIRLFVSAAHSSAERTTQLVTCEYP